MKNALKYLIVCITAASIFLTAAFFFALNRDKDPIPVQERPCSVHNTDGRININTASAQELMTLPGIGEKLAQSIIDYRSIHGPFIGTGQLLLIEGLGAGKLDGILDLITVGG